MSDSQSLTAMLREAGDAWVDDDVPRLAASLACYTLLSIAPLVVLSVAVAGLALPFARNSADVDKLINAGYVTSLRYKLELFVAFHR